MTKKDIYDGEPWTAEAEANLRQVLRNGDHTIVEAAGYLCRSGTVDDVRCKARELGLID